MELRKRTHQFSAALLLWLYAFSIVPHSFSHQHESCVQSTHSVHNTLSLSNTQKLLEDDCAFCKAQHNTVQDSFISSIQVFVPKYFSASPFQPSQIPFLQRAENISLRGPPSFFC